MRPDRGGEVRLQRWRWRADEEGCGGAGSTIDGKLQPKEEEGVTEVAERSGRKGVKVEETRVIPVAENPRRYLIDKGFTGVDVIYRSQRFLC